MDCYTGRNFEDFVVPNYQETSSETCLDGMWGGWSMNSPEAAEKCFDYDRFNSQMGMRTSQDEEEEEEEESKRSKLSTALLRFTVSKESNRWMIYSCKAHFLYLDHFHYYVSFLSV